MSYRYYYNVFHTEFATQLGFGVPKTDCCNQCVQMTSQKTLAAKNQDANLFEEVKLQLEQHLQLAEDRRLQMTIDLGETEAIDPRKNNTTLEHNFDGSLVEIFGPHNIFIVLF